MFERLVRFHAASRPDATAVILPRRTVTFADLNADVQRFAARLRERVATGSLVAILGDDFYPHLVARVAIAQLGAASMVIFPQRGPDPVAVYQAAKPDLLLCPSGLGDVPKSAMVIDASWWEDPVPTKPVRAEKPSTDDDLAEVLVLPANGGAPRQVALTRAMVDARLFALASGLQVGTGARILSLFTMDNALGAAAPFLAWLVGGTAMAGVVTLTGKKRPRQLRPDLVLANIEQTRAAFGSAREPPGPMPWVRLVWADRAPVPETVRNVAEHITPNLRLLYAPAETGPAAAARAEDVAGQAREGGFLLPWAEARIVKAGGIAGAGQAGELLVKTPFMAAGYRGDEEQTRAAFSDGWFRPGETAQMSEEGLLLVGEAH